MDSVPVHAELDGLRLSDWIQASGISRSTAYELLKLLAIDPEPRRLPTSRKPVSHLTGHQMETLAPWVAELKNGISLAQIRERLGQSKSVRDDSSGQSGIVPADSLAAVLTVLSQQKQPVDPLRVARGLAEAAELGVALSTAELAGMLGVASVTVCRWPDGYQPRPGFTLRRQKVASNLWWTVIRD